MANAIPTLQGLIESVVNSMGYIFVGCELQGNTSGRLLRVYIDKKGGILLDDCSRVSHQLSAMLDVEDPIRGAYSLEVSSPGLNRPLFTLDQYQQQLGQKIKVTLLAREQNRRKWMGVLTLVEGNNIHLLVDGAEVILSFSEIEKANVVADIRG